MIPASLTQDILNSWPTRLAANLAGYGSIVAPMLIVYYCLKKRGYLKPANEFALPASILHRQLNRLIRLCILGARTQPTTDDDVPLLADTKTSNGSVEKSAPAVEKNGDVATEETPPEDGCRRTCQLIVCFVGLWTSYLTWGALQEKLMTQQYCDDNGLCEAFKNSQFLVFLNRLSAFFFALLFVCISQNEPAHIVPLYKYSYCSFSNIMSSWCQYEVLKFITFPTQVLGKSSKIIAVMLMGWLVSRKTYPIHQYCTALFISTGIALFMLSDDTRSSKPIGDKSDSTSVSDAINGLILMVGYLMFDSFTANWQSDLFQKYKMSSIQMMLGVNFFSSLFTIISLVEQGGFISSVQFAVRHSPQFAVDAAVLSLCSAVGQIFIFYTVAKFGPVTFTIIMTVRQAMAILLSCLLYGHEITITGLIGIVVVFAAVLTRTYLNQIFKVKKVPVPTEANGKDPLAV